MKVVEETNFMTEVVQVLQMETPQAATASLQQGPSAPPSPLMRTVRPVTPVQVQVLPQSQWVQSQVYYNREIPFDQM